MKKIAILIVVLSLLCTCSKVRVQHFNGQAFGTLYSVSYIGLKDDSLKAKTDSLLSDLSSIFSIFDTNSAIFKFNNGEDILLDNDFLYLTNLSKEVSRETEGAFDCTVQPLVQLWGFGKGGVRRIVPDDSLTDAKKHVGFHLVEVKNNQVLRLDSAVQLNFNAIAKGFAVDKLADFLESMGYSNCLVEIGGEIAARGDKNGKPWKVGIQVPCNDANGAQQSFNSFPLKHHRAVATSGNYRNYFEELGTRYTHILDPRTGKPEKTNLLSVSVVAPDCATADAFATAFMVLGFEKSSNIVKKNPNIEAWFIIAEDNNKWKVVEVR